MPEKFFEPGKGRSARVSQLFGRIAPRYDLVNDLQSFGLHRHWKRKVIKLAGPYPGARALDICCGTGDLAFGLAARGAQVVGLDFSEPMLRVAERRRSRLETSPTPGNACFVLGDAQRLALPENCFEIVTIGYGLRNLPSWEAGLIEMNRVLAPGGRLIILEFGKPENPIWRALYFGYLKLFVPIFGLTLCGSARAYAYILESLQHYPAQQVIARRMEALGLTQVRVFNLLGGAMSIHYGEKPAQRQ
jgi:demethylmenaquinone methyltransferase/2-methoxy-6-polyprenyl-1,4-benzoquinol methylase